MKPKVRILALASAALLAGSGLAYVLLAPFYEAGAWKAIVPILGAADLIAAYAIFGNRAWFKNWARPFAIGSLIVAVPFWGQSQEAYGTFGSTMLVAETAFIVACVVLLALTFANGFLTFMQKQG